MYHINVVNSRSAATQLLAGIVQVVQLDYNLQVTDVLKVVIGGEVV